MAELEVIDLAEGFGSEIRGLDPSIPLDDEIAARLRDVFDDRGVVLFRDFDIGQPFQKYLANLLIGVELPPEEVEQDLAAGNKKPTYVSNREGGGAAPYGRLLFHSDMMWSDNPCQAISLYGVEVEAPAVPTQFVSTARAWATLPDDLRARVEGLHALQGHERTYPNRGGDDDVIDAVFEEPKLTTTPVGRPHPRTERTLLYVSQQVTREIVELSPEENEEVLEALFAHLYDPTNVYGHEWRQGDLVIWDNLAIQHARPNVQLDGPTRTLRKVFAPTPDPISIRQLPSFSKVELSRSARLYVQPLELEAADPPRAVHLHVGVVVVAVAVDPPSVGGADHHVHRPDPAGGRRRRQLDLREARMVGGDHVGVRAQPIEQRLDARRGARAPLPVSQKKSSVTVVRSSSKSLVSAARSYRPLSCLMASMSSMVGLAIGCGMTCQPTIWLASQGVGTWRDGRRTRLPVDRFRGTVEPDGLLPELRGQPVDVHLVVLVVGPRPDRALDHFAHRVDRFAFPDAESECVVVGRGVDRQCDVGRKPTFERLGLGRLKPLGVMDVMDDRDKHAVPVDSSG